MADIGRRTRLARLLIGPPSMVYEELKIYSADVQASPWGAQSDELEIALAARDDPLIDLGLASYAASNDVVGELYRNAKADPNNPLDDKSKQGIRLAVLANETVSARRIMGRFPENTIGKVETAYVIKEAPWSEAQTLLLNPTVADDVLLALYRGDGFAEGIDETRRRELVTFSGSSPRLANHEDSDDGPDMGHYDLHKAIFEMLGTVPTSKQWARNLGSFLDCLDTSHTANPDDIGPVLERWKLNEEGESDEPESKNYTATGLSDRQELRCLIGALYGKSYKRKEVAVHGSADDSDVANRCAYYGNASLKVQDIKEGFERDKDVFVFVAMLNDSIFHDKKLRKEFEEECLNSSHTHRYQLKLAQIKNRWKWIDTRPIAEWMTDADSEAEALRYATERQIMDLQKQLNESVKAMTLLLYVIGALTIATLWFR
jgi:hypothetical protein